MYMFFFETKLNFSKNISQKVNVIKLLEFEIEASVQLFGPDAIGISYIYLSSSSSSYRAGSTDIPDPLSPLLPIVHRPR